MNFRRNMPATPVGFQMAPLIDIVFLCLIFFMVSSVVARWEAKMGITVPTAASEPPGSTVSAMYAARPLRFAVEGSP